MPRSSHTITLGRISLAGAKVDGSAHVLRDVSIIQKGEALGHNFEVDDVMLQQVYDLMAAKPKGVKSRLTHPGLSDCGGWDGIETTLGRVKATGIENGKVRGDLYLGAFATMTPAGDLRSYVEAIAAEDPELLGISISFDPDEFVERLPAPGSPKDQPALLPLGRVKDVMAADLVGDPAANRDGLLSRLPPSVLKSIPGEMLARWKQDLEQLAGGGALPMSRPQTKEPLMPTKPTQLATEPTTEPTTEPAVNAAVHCTACGTVLAAESKFCGACGSATTAPKALTKPGKTADEFAAARSARNVESLQQIATLGKMPEAWTNGKILGLADAPDAEVFLKAARKEAVDALAAGNQPIAISVGVDKNIQSLREALPDALMLKAGRADQLYQRDSNGRVKVLGRNSHGGAITERRNPHDRAQQLQYMSLMDMAKACLNAQGVNTEAMSRSQVARLSFNRAEVVRHTGNVSLYASTADFSNILADMINKGVGDAFQLAPDTTQWCRMRAIPDFKQISTVKLSAAPKLVQVTPGASYQILNFTDQGEKYYLAKYGVEIIFNWETLINDDLNVFTFAPIAMGMAAKATKLDVVYAILTGGATAAIKMADGGVLFNATATTTTGGHANLGSGAISVTSWGACKASMGKQKSNGQLLNNLPKYLLAPLELEGAAANVVLPNAILGGNSTTVTTAQNPYAGKVEPIFEQRLSVDSAAKWYAASDPGLMDTVEIGYLEGEPEPVIEQENAFDYDGRKLKTRYTVAAKAADYRGLFASSGS